MRSRRPLGVTGENLESLEASLEPILRSMILKRFRSIPAETVSFDNPTFLVGQNGSGKSNFVDAFAFLAEAMVSPLQGVFDRRGGISPVRNRSSGQSYPPNLGLGVTLGAINGDTLSARYAFEIRALKNYGFESTRKALQQHLMGAGELLRSNALNAPTDLFLSHDLDQRTPFDEDLE